jgi:cell division protein FtsW (lipid II flippase)
MVEVKSDIEKFETTLALGKMGANFRKSSPNTKEPSALSVQDCDWDPRVAAGRDAMWFLIETLLFLIVVASNLYWRWSGNWYLAVIIAVIVAVIVARLIYWALSARAELILRKDWLGRR